MPNFVRDDVTFNYLDSGSGTPFVFQHGLGADATQPFSLFRPPAGFRLLAFDARAHGETRPVGDENKISLTSFADDLHYFLDHLGIAQAVVGGISMGSAIALNFALRYPERVLGLVISRPAWLDHPKPTNVQWTTRMAALIRAHGAARAKELFVQSPEYAELFREAPAIATGLARQFDAPRVEETVARLERIPPDAPCRSLAELKAIRVPALVMACREDPVHPFEYAEILRAAIPGAVLYELAPKWVSPEQHTADVQTHVEAFLMQHFAGV